MKEYSIRKRDLFPDGKATIYTVQEAIELGIEFIENENWRSAQYGEYAETDDGFVTPIIQRNDKSNPAYLKTPTGCFAINRSGTVFDTEEFYNRNSFTRKSKWNGNHSTITGSQAVFFKRFAETFDIEGSIKFAYPDRKPFAVKALAREISRSKLFKEFMNRYKKKFEEVGITEEYLIEKLKDMLDRSTPATFPTLAKMGAAGLSTGIFEGQQQLKSGNEDQPLFDKKDDKEIEEAKYEVQNSFPMKAVR